MLHLAYKYSQVEIAKLLESKMHCDAEARNHRGLTPTQMNHKKLFNDGLEFDLEPDYCFVVKKARAAFFID